MSLEHLHTPTGPWLRRQSIDYATLTDTATRIRRAKSPASSFVLRGRKMRSRAGLFDEWAAALQFPYYFGGTWNAFVDCVGDLDWLRDEPIIVWIRDAIEVLADGDADELGAFLDILHQAGEEHAKANELRPSRAFHVVLQYLPERREMLERRLVGTRHVIPEV